MPTLSCSREAFPTMNFTGTKQKGPQLGKYILVQLKERFMVFISWIFPCVMLTTVHFMELKNKPTFEGSKYNYGYCECLCLKMILETYIK